MQIIKNIVIISLVMKFYLEIIVFYSMLRKGYRQYNYKPNYINYTYQCSTDSQIYIVSLSILLFFEYCYYLKNYSIIFHFYFTSKKACYHLCNYQYLNLSCLYTCMCSPRKIIVHGCCFILSPAHLPHPSVLSFFPSVFDYNFTQLVLFKYNKRYQQLYRWSGLLFTWLCQILEGHKGCMMQLLWQYWG